MTIRRRQLEYIGQMLRKTELEKVCMMGKVKRIRTRLRQIMRYLQSLKSDTDIENT